MAIVGSRNCKGLELEDIVAKIPEDTSLIISGGAHGVDGLAESAASRLGISFLKILPDYQTYGKAAPIVRNQEIVGQADLVLAFWDYTSRGTASVIAGCIEQHVPVEVFGIACWK